MNVWQKWKRKGTENTFRFPQHGCLSFHKRSRSTPERVSSESADTVRPHRNKIRDILKEDLQRSRQQLYAVKEVSQLNFLKTLQKLVDSRSNIAEMLPRNPVFDMAEELLRQLDQENNESKELLDVGASPLKLMN